MKYRCLAVALSSICLSQARAGSFEDAVSLVSARQYGKALAAFRVAAAEGNAAAERELGFMYYRGTGVVQSDSEALVWFERAAAHGDLRSQINLGQMYENGLSVQQDDARSAHWYRLAAEQGDRNSQIRIGEIFYLGTGIPKDRAEAVKWWRLAMRAEDARALQMRGLVESALNKIPQDVQEEGMRRAEQWLQARAQRE